MENIDLGDILQSLDEVEKQNSFGLDLSEIQNSLTDVQKKVEETENEKPQIQSSFLLKQADELLEEINSNIKKIDSKIDKKIKSKKCKKVEKSRSYFEKQEIKQKKIKNLRKK